MKIDLPFYLRFFSKIHKFFGRMLVDVYKKSKQGCQMKESATNSNDFFLFSGQTSTNIFKL